MLLENSEKIRTSAWITLAILGSTILITMYGETMLLPAIRDIISECEDKREQSDWRRSKGPRRYDVIW